MTDEVIPGSTYLIYDVCVGERSLKRKSTQYTDVVHFVMELCEGGELFDGIRGHYSKCVAIVVTGTSKLFLKIFLYLNEAKT